MGDQDLRPSIEAAFAERALLKDAKHADAVRAAVDALDQGRLRVAEKQGGQWVTNAWVKQAILLYFALSEMQVHEVGPFEFHDKIPLKKNHKTTNKHKVPPGSVRHGAFLEPGAEKKPNNMNIGARVGAGTM